MSRPTRATIDLSALGHNLQYAKTLATDSKIMAVIKANGYGHGILHAAQGLAQADGFAVACLEEAVVLRDAGYTQTVLLLEGVFQPQELAAVHKLSLTMVVHNKRQLEWLEQATLPGPVSVWLKIDSGMHRLGIQPHELDEVYLRLQSCVNVNQSIVLMTHLANADDRRDSYSTRQCESFNQTVQGIQAPLSIANSAALISLPDTRTEWVRPGIMLYGASPFTGPASGDQQLKPVMTLRSQLIAIDNYRRGDRIGYGGTWVCPKDMAIGVVAIGYGDGYPRHAGSTTPVLVNGHKTTLAGRVSMDMITVDLSTVPEARIGDEVVLWGTGLPVEEVAESAGTISYELMCHVTSRVHVEVINANDNTLSGQ